MSEFHAKKLVFVKIPNSKNQGIQQDKFSGPYYVRMLQDLSKITGNQKVILVKPIDVDLWGSTSLICNIIGRNIQFLSIRELTQKYMKRDYCYRKAANKIFEYLTDDSCDVLIMFCHEEFSSELPYFFALDILDKPLRSFPVQDYGYHIIDLEELTITMVDNMATDSYNNDDKTTGDEINYGGEKIGQH